ncbi:PREDICTED: lysM and putative peptidoglycan-binding domain-containing protein 2-like [Amphimedon queenslandica]|uniref:LysM domain-containing protein n=1 Tax=Amphimedon queenslandica TaxID=400682 RepID=A0AAN0IQ16_AMPQE|nr:PREDICTED: lysM and putative peptidoglycan-binding domain-containing protein 2-like [Amphimedon queenslandica]|eukprot:XP_011405886.1 PREDICTED: lysM and putative peptidoglycan-binding domain-containing protein 2-like [Amphimedon queenslandica]
MAAYANGIEITQETISPASSPPSTVKRPSGKGEKKEAMSSKGDSHSSLVHQSQKGRHYGTVGKGRHRENGHLIHNITASDTLQGIALKYGVTIADIQRSNLLLGNESIHRYKILKIPLSVSSSPQPSPSLDHRKTETRTSSSQLVSSMEEEEEEVKRKPSSLVAGERDIMSLLNAVDQQLLVSKSFADKLAEKK